MSVEEATGPPFELWPDNAVAVNVFTAMSTQWNIGPGGAVGFLYEWDGNNKTGAGEQ